MVKITRRSNCYIHAFVLRKIVSLMMQLDALRIIILQLAVDAFVNDDILLGGTIALASDPMDVATKPATSLSGEKHAKGCIIKPAHQVNM